MRNFAVTELMRLHKKEKMYTEKIRIVVRFDASENGLVPPERAGKFYGIHEVTTGRFGEEGIEAVSLERLFTDERATCCIRPLSAVWS